MKSKHNDCQNKSKQWNRKDEKVDNITILSYNHVLDKCKVIKYIMSLIMADYNMDGLASCIIILLLFLLINGFNQL